MYFESVEVVDKFLFMRLNPLLFDLVNSPYDCVVEELFHFSTVSD
jgi:hypothetical protein